MLLKFTSNEELLFYLSSLSFNISMSLSKQQALHMPVNKNIECNYYITVLKLTYKN